MMTHTFPRILIVGSANILKDNSSSSMTVRSFINGWPESHIFQLLCKNDDNEERGVISDTIFVINNRDLKLRFKTPTKKTSSLIQPIDKKVQTSGFSLSHQLSVFARDLYSLLTYKYSKELDEFILNNRIEAIYTCSFNPRVYYLIDKISRKHTLPIFPHFLDDWPNVMFRGSFFSKPLYNIFNARLKSIIKNSPQPLAISELMCRVYNTRYQKKFIPLMHSVFPTKISNCSDDSNVITLLYAGSLYLDRYNTILDICHTIVELGLKDTFEVHLYVSPKQWNELLCLFKRYHFVKFMGFVSHEELMNRIAGASGLLLVESFENQYLEYTQLSMSTKIPEFLSSSKPICAIGHKDQGSIEYLLRNSAALVATTKEEIKDVILKLNTCRGTEVIINNARRLFENNHNQEHQRKKFHQILTSWK